MTETTLDDGIPAEAPIHDGARRETLRADAIASIPSWYNPWLHLGLTTAICLSVAVAAVWGVTSPSWTDLLTIPITLLAANGVEWRAHKDVLHKRRWFAPILYDRHTPVHHMVYGYDDMAVRSYRELRLVLLPSFGIAVIVLSGGLFAGLAGYFFGRNVAWFVLACSGLYVMAYEWSHMAYHLPTDTLIGRSWLVRILREHHRRHHEPRLMQRWNFNVTIPLFDWLHRTIASRELVEKSRQSDARTPPI